MDRTYLPSRSLASSVVLHFLTTANKVPASFVSPLPLYFAACGYAHSGRVIFACCWSSPSYFEAMIVDGAAPFSTHCSRAASTLCCGSSKFSCPTCSERVRARAAVAVLHARHHVKAHERIRVVLPHLRDDSVVIVHRVQRRNRRIIPAVIHNQFSAPRFEWPQIRIGRVQRACSFFVGGFQSASSRKGFVIPVGFFIHHVREISDPEERHQALGRSRAGDPESPAALAHPPRRANSRGRSRVPSNHAVRRKSSSTPRLAARSGTCRYLRQPCTGSSPDRSGTAADHSEFRRARRRARRKLSVRPPRSPEFSPAE